MQTAKNIRHLVTLTILLLAGCSSHKYFDVIPAESIVEHDGNKTVTVHDWQNYPTTSLIENCFNTAPVSAVLAAAIISCNDELLSREDLAEPSRHQALQHYNQALAKLVQFTLNSQQKAAQAQRNGRFSKEITPFTFQPKRGVAVVISEDEHLRPQTTFEALGNG